MTKRDDGWHFLLRPENGKAVIISERAYLTQKECEIAFEEWVSNHPSLSITDRMQ